MLAIDPRRPFSLEDFKAVVSRPQTISLSPESLRRVNKSFKLLNTVLARGNQVIYGIHTGVGVLQKTRVSSDWDSRQRNLVASHACGVGEPLEPQEVRTIIYLRSRELSRGFSAINPATLKAYAGLLRDKKLPRVPSQGSVGACGDLIPLSHIAQHLFAQIPDGALGPRDGLALINGTQASLAVGLLSWVKASRLIDYSLKTAALSLYAVEGKTEALDEGLVGLKKHPGSQKVAAQISHSLGTYKNTGLPQDPYSLRALPQVVGAADEIHDYAGGLFAREADSITDNPVFLGKAPNILHGANFHGIHVALASDLEAWALNILGLMSERRVNVLLAGGRGLPAMLASQDGASGLMMAHVTQAACLAETKILAHPASADSIPTSANQEDVVPMAMGASLKLKKVLNNIAYVLTIEALCASRAICLLKKEAKLKKQTQLRPFLEEIKSLAGDTLISENGSYSKSIARIAERFLTI